MSFQNGSLSNFSFSIVVWILNCGCAKFFNLKNDIVCNLLLQIRLSICFMNLYASPSSHEDSFPLTFSVGLMVLKCFFSYLCSWLHLSGDLHKGGKFIIKEG